MFSTSSIEKRVTQRQRGEVTRLVGDLDSITSRIRRDFLKAFERIAERIDPKELIRLLREGRIAEAVDIVNVQAIASGVRPVAASSSDAVLSAGRAAAARVPAEYNVTFGAANPRTVDFMRNNELRLVRELTLNARSAIRDTITQGLAAGRNPVTIARDVRANLKLTRRQATQVNNYRALLEEQRRRAIESQKKALTDQQIDRMVASYQRKALNNRAKTVARTEATRANNRGYQDGWRQAVEDGTISADEVRRFWVYTKDRKTRDSHREIPKMNKDGVGLEEPFRSPLGPIMYPGDPDASAENTINCRCTVFIKYVPRRAR